MVKKGELTDEAWSRIAPLLPENGRRGGRWRDHHEVVNGILWKLRTGAPWRDVSGRTSMPRVPAEGRASKTQKGGLTPRGRGARAEPKGADNQAAPLLRRQGEASLGLGHARTVPREHPAGGGARRDPGGAPQPRTAAQTPRAPARRPGLQLPSLPGAAAFSAASHTSSPSASTSASAAGAGRRSSIARPTAGATWWRGA